MRRWRRRAARRDRLVGSGLGQVRSCEAASPFSQIAICLPFVYLFGLSHEHCTVLCCADLRIVGHSTFFLSSDGYYSCTSEFRDLQ